MPTLESAILSGDHKEVFDTVCRDRLIINSVVYNDGKSLLMVESLRNAKIIARKLCKETKKRVVINHHQPFDPWREYINVYYGDRRLKWYYLHIDALAVKNV